MVNLHLFKQRQFYRAKFEELCMLIPYIQKIHQSECCSLFVVKTKLSDTGIELIQFQHINPHIE